MLTKSKKKIRKEKTTLTEIEKRTPGIVAFKTSFFSDGKTIKDGPIFSLIKVQISFTTHPTVHLAIPKELAVISSSLDPSSSKE